MSERASNFDGHLRLGNVSAVKLFSFPLSSPLSPFLYFTTAVHRINHLKECIYVMLCFLTSAFRVFECYISLILTLTVLLDFPVLHGWLLCR